MPKTTEVKGQYFVMPPIWRFHIPGHPKESKWGWHKVEELIRAINDNLRLMGEKPITKIRDIEERFRHHSPQQYQKLGIGIGKTIFPIFYLTIKGGKLTPTRSKHKWLWGLRKDGYLPAKIGLAILKEIREIKRPINRFQKLLSAILPEG